MIMIPYLQFKFSELDKEDNLMLCLMVISYCVHISGVELSGFLEEGEPWVRVHNVLDHAQEVFGQEVVPHAAAQHAHKSGRRVMAGRDYSVQVTETWALIIKALSKYRCI